MTQSTNVYHYSQCNNNIHDVCIIPSIFISISIFQLSTIVHVARAALQKVLVTATGVARAPPGLRATTARCAAVAPRPQRASTSCPSSRLGRCTRLRCALVRRRFAVPAELLADEIVPVEGRARPRPQC